MRCPPPTVKPRTIQTAQFEGHDQRRCVQTREAGWRTWGTCGIGAISWTVDERVCEFFLKSANATLACSEEPCFIVRCPFRWSTKQRSRAAAGGVAYLSVWRLASEPHHRIDLTVGITCQREADQLAMSKAILVLPYHMTKYRPSPCFSAHGTVMNLRWHEEWKKTVQSETGKLPSSEVPLNGQFNGHVQGGHLHRIWQIERSSKFLLPPSSVLFLQFFLAIHWVNCCSALLKGGVWGLQYLTYFQNFAVQIFCPLAKVQWFWAFEGWKACPKFFEQIILTPKITENGKNFSAFETFVFICWNSKRGPNRSILFQLLGHTIKLHIKTCFFKFVFTVFWMEKQLMQHSIKTRATSTDGVFGCHAV